MNKDIQKLIKELKEGENKLIRLRAAIALGDIEDEEWEITNSLRAAYLEEENAKVREEIVKSLGRKGKGSNEIVSTLVDAMMDDKSESVREYAAESLGELGDIAIPAILSTIRNESNVQVIEKAITTLGEIGKRVQKEAPELIKSLITDIITVLEKYNLEVLHREATSAFCKMGEAAVLPLLEHYKKQENVDVKRQLEITFERLAEKLGYRNRLALIRAYDSE
jgi:HEAT repeat protein